jgi:hypothetical protein|tara:strand:- start:1379 stop:1711 length:333 start_codon:yes stop_codon:yes gene_type:complete
MKYLLSAFIILTVVFFANSLQAQVQPLQPFCGPIDQKEKFLKNIKDKYNEIKIFRGVSNRGGHIIEIYFNPESTSFTVMGISVTHICVLDYGENADFIIDVPVKKKETGA